MANVYDLANELERAVRALPEYQAVLTAKAAIENDAIWPNAKSRRTR